MCVQTARDLAVTHDDPSDWRRLCIDCSCSWCSHWQLLALYRLPFRWLEISKLQRSLTGLSLRYITSDPRHSNLGLWWIALDGFGFGLVKQSARSRKGTSSLHNDAPQSVGLLWTSDQLVAETSTWQHTTLTTDKYPCPRWDSNPRSQHHRSLMWSFWI